MSGFIDDNDSNVYVNGIQANVSNNHFSQTVPLHEGMNAVTATATNLAGNSSSDVSTLSLNTATAFIHINQYSKTLKPNANATVEVTWGNIPQTGTYKLRIQFENWNYSLCNYIDIPNPSITGSNSFNIPIPNVSNKTPNGRFVAVIFDINTTWSNVLTMDATTKDVDIIPLKPIITNESPTSTTGPRPTISAKIYSPWGININPSSISIKLDNTPVSFTTSGSGSDVTVSYKPQINLSNSNHTVAIDASDINGQRADTKSWGFISTDDIDNRPLVVDEYPIDTALSNTYIKARVYSPIGTEISISSIQLKLNGVPLLYTYKYGTRDGGIKKSEVFVEYYAQHLSPGYYTVTVNASDINGLSAEEKFWNFTVFYDIISDEVNLIKYGNKAIYDYYFNQNSTSPPVWSFPYEPVDDISWNGLSTFYEKEINTIGRQLIFVTPAISRSGNSFDIKVLSSTLFEGFYLKVYIGDLQHMTGYNYLAAYPAGIIDIYVANSNDRWNDTSSIIYSVIAPIEDDVIYVKVPKDKINLNGTTTFMAKLRDETADYTSFPDWDAFFDYLVLIYYPYTPSPGIAHLRRAGCYIYDIIPITFNVQILDSSDKFLKFNDPNPININYNITHNTQFNPSSITLKIYQGSTLIKTQPLPLTGGDQTTTWDGKDNLGNFVQVGEYEAIIEVSENGIMVESNRYKITVMPQEYAKLISVEAIDSNDNSRKSEVELQMVRKNMDELREALIKANKDNPELSWPENTPIWKVNGSDYEVGHVSFFNYETSSDATIMAGVKDIQKTVTITLVDGKETKIAVTGEAFQKMKNILERTASALGGSNDDVTSTLQGEYTWYYIDQAGSPNCMRTDELSVGGKFELSHKFYIPGLSFDILFVKAGAFAEPALTLEITGINIKHDGSANPVDFTELSGGAELSGSISGGAGFEAEDPTQITEIKIIVEVKGTVGASGSFEVVLPGPELKGNYNIGELVLSGKVEVHYASGRIVEYEISKKAWDGINGEGTANFSKYFSH